MHPTFLSSISIGCWKVGYHIINFYKTIADFTNLVKLRISWCNNQLYLKDLPWVNHLADTCQAFIWKRSQTIDPNFPSCMASVQKAPSLPGSNFNAMFSCMWWEDKQNLNKIRFEQWIVHPAYITMFHVFPTFTAMSLASDPCSPKAVRDRLDQRRHVSTCHWVAFLEARVA